MLFLQDKENTGLKNTISNQNYDEERALYNIQNTIIDNCTFAGPKDGESVLKESRNIKVINCNFSLRYPLWHAHKFILENSTLDELTRAPIWYGCDGTIVNTQISSIKCLRDCQNITILDSKILSPEFGWKCNNINLSKTYIESEYIFFDSKNVELNNVEMKGKYSFQYMENLKISNSNLDTKDAFWHSKNVTVENSVVKGEYLAWFSENLTLINCTIIGTQPLCYCKNLVLKNCKMIDTDLAFEFSDVNADIIGHIDSVKNPKSGIVIADTIGEIITEQDIYECHGIIKQRIQN